MEVCAKQVFSPDSHRAGNEGAVQAQKESVNRTGIHVSERKL